jgi:hypothetical protein
MGRKSNAQLEKEKKEKEELEKEKKEKEELEKEKLEKQKSVESSEQSEETENLNENEDPNNDPPSEEDTKITLENFKIKKGIPDYTYNGFKISLKSKNDTEFDLKDLEKKYDDFMNKKL